MLSKSNCVVNAELLFLCLSPLNFFIFCPIPYRVNTASGGLKKLIFSEIKSVNFQIKNRKKILPKGYKVLIFNLLGYFFFKAGDLFFIFKGKKALKAMIKEAPIPRPSSLVGLSYSLKALFNRGTFGPSIIDI